MNRVLLFLAGIPFCAFVLVPQSPSQQVRPDQTATTLRSTAQEVILDMVFRDKKGRPLRNVRSEEIHVLEDGVEQKLTSFRLVEGNSAAAAKASSSAKVAEGASPQLDPIREVRLVTLVFEGLDQEQKQFFRQTLRDLLDMAPEQNLYFSIMAIDQALHLIQPFTSDHAALLKSVDQSMMWSFTQYRNQSTEMKERLRQTLSSGESGGQSSVTGDLSQPPVFTQTQDPSQSRNQNSAILNWKMAKAQYDEIRSVEAADREDNARTTMAALMGLVQAQSELPGRKVVLYFNPWLYVSDSVKEQYAKLISTANRANVTFYTVDPKGLVTWSQNKEGRELLSGATGEIRWEQMKPDDGLATKEEVLASETAETALRTNPLEWLRDLAQQTGGATIGETNDWKAPLRAVMEEVHNYYEAAYIPHIAAYDGKFRKISVRVDRPDVVVHTRSGYFALPQPKSGPQFSAYETPLINAMNMATPPADIPFQAAAERFNDHGPKIEYMVTLEAPLKGFTFTPKPDQKNVAVDAAMLAFVRNSSGEIVDRFNKDLAVQVALDKLEAYKAGNLIQTFPIELSPGTYTLEAVIMDRNNNKVGVEKSVLTVPAASNKLAMSDVVVVRRIDALRDNEMLDAFYFPGGKIVPTLTRRLKGGPGNTLPFYFTVYPDRTLKDVVKLTISFYKDGEYVGEAEEVPLPEMQDGRIPYIANLPADDFRPGAYEIHIGVTQGNSEVEKDVAVQVE